MELQQELVQTRAQVNEQQQQHAQLALQTVSAEEKVVACNSYITLLQGEIEKGRAVQKANTDCIATMQKEGDRIWNENLQLKNDMTSMNEDNKKVVNQYEEQVKVHNATVQHAENLKALCDEALVVLFAKNGLRWESNTVDTDVVIAPFALVRS